MDRDIKEPLSRVNARLRYERLKAARAKATHTHEQWEALLLLCGNMCVRCRIGQGPLQKDHIVPIYQGGSDGIENIQPLCKKCNASKGPEDIDHRIDHLRWLWDSR